MAKLSPVFNSQTVDANGDPAVGYKLFTYDAGSSTKQTTFTDEAGLVPQTNPIILNSLGFPTNGPIWQTEGREIKYVLALPTDADPPTSPVRTIDNVSGVGDNTVSVSQWIVSGVAPTYVSATSFTLSGDQTNEFQVGRRIQASVSLGTVYGYISASAYTSLTTVSVTLDSGALDSGLSSLSLGLLTPDNPSAPILKDSNFRVSGSADKTKRVAFEVDGLTAGTTRTLIIPDASGTIATVETLPTTQTSRIQPIAASVSSDALTLTLNPTVLDFRSPTLGSGAVNTRTVASAITLVVSSGSTLGTVSAQAARLVVLAIDNAGTVELAVVNLTGGNNLDETTLISTTAEGGVGGADSASTIYSTTARTSVPFRVVGFVDVTEVTAGTWATAPSTVQGAGGLSIINMSMPNWQVVTGSRAKATTYTNSTGREITISVSASMGVSLTFAIYVDGVIVASCATGSGSGAVMSLSADVPPNSTYAVQTAGTVTLWTEKR
jgi:hypothetical protein